MECKRCGVQWYELIDGREVSSSKCPTTNCGGEGRDNWGGDWALWAAATRELTALIVEKDPETVLAYVDDIPFKSPTMKPGLRLQVRFAIAMRNDGVDVEWAGDGKGTHTDFTRAEGDVLIRIDVTNDNGLTKKYSRFSKSLAGFYSGHGVGFTKNHRIVLPPTWEELSFEDLKKRRDFAKFYFSGSCNGYFEQLKRANKGEFNGGNPLSDFFQNAKRFAEVVQPSPKVLGEWLEANAITEKEFDEAMARQGLIQEFQELEKRYESDKLEAETKEGERKRILKSKPAMRLSRYRKNVTGMVPGLDEGVTERVAQHLLDNKGVELRDVIEESLLVLPKDNTEEVVYLRRVLVFTDDKEIETCWEAEEDEGF